MEKEGSFPLDANLSARASFLESPYLSETVRERVSRLARARRDFQRGERKLFTPAIARKFATYWRPTMASKQIETTLAQLAADAESGDEAARARLERITRLADEATSQKADPQSILRTSSSAEAARIEELESKLERMRQKSFDRALIPWRKKFPGFPDEILLRVAARGSGAKPTAEETSEAAALAQSKLEREEQELLASVRRVEAMEAAAAMAMSATEAGSSMAMPTTRPSAPPQVATPTLVDASLFTDDESEDEGAAAVKSARTRYKSGEEYRILDKEREKEREAFRVESSDGRTSEREEREWRESEENFVPYLKMIDELALDHLTTFYILTYKTRSPLGVERTHYLPIQSFSDYKAECTRLKAEGNVIGHHSMILKTDPDTEIIVPDKDNPREKFVPVEVALRADAFSDEMKATLPATFWAEDELRTPRILRLYDKEGEYKAVTVKGLTHKDPKEEDGILHINVRMEDIGEIDLGPKDIVIASVDGVPTFRDQSGTFCFYDKKKGRWITNSSETHKEWPETLFTRFTELKKHRRNSYAELGQALKVCEEKAEKNTGYRRKIANQANELASSRAVIDELNDQLRELKKRLEECEKHRDKMRKKAEDSEDSDDDNAPGAVLGPTPRVNPNEPEITTLAAATNNKTLNTSIEMWGAAGSVAARPWLKSSTFTCESLRVAPEVIPLFLINKLKVHERTKMGELSAEGKITDMATFTKQFLEIYGKKLSPFSQLREMSKRKMTAAEVAKNEYYGFGNRLENDMHEAFNGLGLDKAHWPIFDSILTLSAYLGAVPVKLAEYLILQEVETLEEAVRESRKWANAVHDSGQSLAASVGHVGTGGQQGQGSRRGGHFGGRRQQQNQPPAQDSQNQQPQQQETGAGGANQEGGKRLPLCRKCRRKKDPPKSCKHCRICGSEDHFAYKCPRLDEKKEKESGDKPG